MNITIKDIARLAKVSHTTVSRALNDSPLIQADTKKRIKELAETLNYTPNVSAKSLVLEKSYNIGFFASRCVENMPTSFAYEVMDGISTVIGDQYNIIFRKFNNAEDVKKNVNTRKYDGAIFLSIDDADMKLVYQLELLDMPKVILNRNLKAQDMYCIYADEYAGTFQAIEYLIKKGHRDIAIIEGPEQFITSEQRYHAYADALEKNGLGVNRQYCVKGGFTPESGFEAMQRLIGLPVKPTAVFASNDLMAAGTMKACSRHGLKIPEDISVIGFDDMDFSNYLVPSLSTVRKSRKRMGEEGAGMLLDILDKKRVADRFRVLETELIIRESCK